MTPAPTIVSCPTCGTKNRVPIDASGRPRCASCHDDLPWLVEAGDGDYRTVVEASPLPVLVDAWAPWCGPCRMVSPIVERMAGTFAGRLKVVKVNVDESPAVARRLGVQGIPALFIVDGGDVVDATVGAAPERQLEGWVERSLAGRS